MVEIQAVHTRNRAGWRDKPGTARAPKLNQEQSSLSRGEGTRAEKAVDSKSNTARRAYFAGVAHAAGGFHAEIRKDSRNVFMIRTKTPHTPHKTLPDRQQQLYAAGQHCCTVLFGMVWCILHRGTRLFVTVVCASGYSQTRFEAALLVAVFSSVPNSRPLFVSKLKPNVRRPLQARV